MAEQKEMNIEVKPEAACGSYSNLAIISHSKTEFILDFASSMPGVPHPVVHNRIIMAPEHAKRLLNALAENIQKYEAVNGPINIGGPKMTFNLGGNGTQN